jgi:hypothetical protein
VPVTGPGASAIRVTTDIPLAAPPGPPAHPFGGCFDMQATTSRRASLGSAFTGEAPTTIYALCSSRPPAPCRRAVRSTNIASASTYAQWAALPACFSAVVRSSWPQFDITPISAAAANLSNRSISSLVIPYLHLHFQAPGPLGPASGHPYPGDGPHTNRIDDELVLALRGRADRCRTKRKMFMSVRRCE